MEYPTVVECMLDETSQANDCLLCGETLDDIDVCHCQLMENKAGIGEADDNHMESS